MSDAPTTPVPTGDGIFSSPLLAIALPKITAAIAGAIGTYAAITPDQANSLAGAIVSGLFAIASVVWSVAKHRNTQSVVARVAAGTPPAVISNSKAL